jgi:hypothetical protein
MAREEKLKTAIEILPQLSESERLKRDIYRPDIEKLQLFTKMLRTNALLKKAIIRHK